MRSGAWSKPVGPGTGTSSLALDDASWVAVPGGGPAGFFFRRLLLDSAERLGLDLEKFEWESFGSRVDLRLCFSEA